MPRFPVTLGGSPIVRRLVWHVRRVGGQLDRRFFLTLAEGIVGFVVLAALLITLLEKPLTFESIWRSVWDRIRRFTDGLDMTNRTTRR